MNIIEMTVSLLAPHICLGCGAEGPPMCNSCTSLLFPDPLPVCYRCRAPDTSGFICNDCMVITGLSSVWAATHYKGSAKDLVSMLKFQRAKAAATVIADHMHAVLPAIPPGTIVAAVPTAESRVRLRGYDQSRLIARRFAKKRHLPYQDVLWRIKTTRQVGANRVERFEFLENAFKVRKISRIKQRDILLIDDILTTGATLESAARELQAAGASSVSAAVFAQTLAK